MERACVRLLSFFFFLHILFILHLSGAAFVHYLSANITPVICPGLSVEQSTCIDSAHKIRPFQVRPPLLLPPSPDVLISSNSYAGQIPGLMMDNLPKVGTAHRHAASLWMPYGQKQLFSLLSLAQMCQTGCRLQSAVLLALGGGCFLLAWQLITLM